VLAQDAVWTDAAGPREAWIGRLICRAPRGRRVCREFSDFDAA
jgi:hypothetical protein